MTTNQSPEGLASVFSRRAGTTVVAGGKELPHCKIYFDKLADAHAFDTALRAGDALLRATLARIDEQVSHGKMGDWSIALNNIRAIVHEHVGLSRTPEGEQP